MVFSGYVHRLIVGYFSALLVLVCVAVAFKCRCDIYILLCGSVSFSGLFFFNYNVNDYCNKFGKLVDVVVYSA